MWEEFTRSYVSETDYSYVTLVRHKGTLVSFAMDKEQRIFYSVLDLSDAGSSEPLDTRHWSVEPRLLPFPDEIAQVGYGVTGQRRLPAVRRADGDGNDPFLSTTARLSADAPFQALSDNRYIYLFRQAITAPHPLMIFADTERTIPLVDATLLVDRYVFTGNELHLTQEVRYQRSRRKYYPQSRKDSLGAADLDGTPFYEPTQELAFIGGLTGGRFTALLLPTQVAEIERWQIFAYNQAAQAIDAYDIERAADGLFNTRGSQFYSCVDHPDVFEARPGSCPAPSATDPSQTCGKLLVPVADDAGVAGWALRGGAMTLDAPFALAGPFTLEAYVRPDASAEGDRLIVGGESDPAAPSLWLVNATMIAAGFGPGRRRVVTGEVLRPGEWSHVAATFTGKSLRIYVDGALAARSSAFDDLSPAAAPIVAVGAAGFPGAIDEVRVWSVARPAEDLRGAMRRRLVGSEPSLEGYWRFDDDRSPIAYDLSLHLRHGRIDPANCVPSDAPIGDGTGVRRVSMRLEGRGVAAGMSAALYHWQQAGPAGYDGQQRPLKQDTRVMLTVPTADGVKNLIAALDFAVSRAGRLAELPSTVALSTLENTGGSVNDALDAISRLEDEIAFIEAEIPRLNDEIARLEGEKTGERVREFNSNIAYLQLTCARLQDAYDRELNKPVYYRCKIRSRKNNRCWRVGAELDEKSVALPQWRMTAEPDLPPGTPQMEPLEQWEFELLDADGGLSEGNCRIHSAWTENTFVVDFGAFFDHGGKDAQLYGGPVDSQRQQQSWRLQAQASDPASPGYLLRSHWNDWSIVSENGDGNDLRVKAGSLSSDDLTQSWALEPNRSILSGFPKPALDAARTALDKAKQDVEDQQRLLQEFLDGLQREIDALTAARDVLVAKLAQNKAALPAARVRLKDAAALPMPLLYVDRAGLAVYGALLGFAWTDTAPRLLDSASGRLALYFRGADGQFFAAYYDTYTARPRLSLGTDQGTISFIARSSDPVLRQLTIRVADDSDPGMCSVTIELRIAGVAISETWSGVPREAAAFAAALNGTSTSYAYTAQRGSKLVAVNATGASGMVPNGVPALADDPTCQWVAAAPGWALRLDGKTSIARLTGDPPDQVALQRLAPDGNLTLEAWVYPRSVNDTARVIHHESARSRYSLGIMPAGVLSALVLNGVDQYVQLNRGVQTGAHFTLEAWIYPTPGPDDQAYHGFLGGQPGDIGVDRAPGLWIYERTRIHTGFGDGATWNSIITGPVLQTSSWNHIAVTFDGTTLVVYVNGIERVPDISLSGRVPCATPITWIGRVDNLFPGAFDEVRIWNVARSPEAIAHDMNRRLTSFDNTLLGYWHFEDGLARDYTGRDGDAQIVGTPQVEQSPLPFYTPFAAVRDQLAVAGETAIPCGEWAHLSAAYRQGYALHFTGRDGWLDCGSDPTLDTTGDLTIEVSLQLDDLNAPHGILGRGALGDAAGQGVPYALAVDRSGKLVFSFETADHKLIRCESDTKLTAGQFAHVAVTRQTVVQVTDSGDVNRHDTVCFYINRAPAGRQPYGPADPGSSDAPLTIGCAFVDARREARLRGKISEARVWSVARKREEIGAALGGGEKGLISWWRFAEGAGTVAYDSKSANHGRIGAGIAWEKTPDPTGSQLLLYVNAVGVTTSASADVSNWFGHGPQFSLGGLSGPGAGERFHGQIEDVRVWSVTRTPEQIRDNMFRRVLEDREDLFAYYTFDPVKDGQPNLTYDSSLNGSSLAVSPDDLILSTAPIGEDFPAVRSALAGVHTSFNDTIDGTPDACEYGDLQRDDDGEMIGVLKRCYAYIKKDPLGRSVWRLTTGFKVGDLVTEWVGQVQFAPTLKGYIEGAPPIPSENMTGRGIELGEVIDYNGSSTVALREAESVTYTFAASKDKGFDTSAEVSAMAGYKSETEAGLVLTKQIEASKLLLGVKATFEQSRSWLDDASTAAGRVKTNVSSIALHGTWENKDEIAHPQLGRRFVPANVGYALVQSETADVFALRLRRNNMLVAYQMRPNPDIPKDWNIIIFPINPRYTKQGTLDGRLALENDADYPNAAIGGSDRSYYKPIEAYSLKGGIQREEEQLRTLYQQFNARKTSDAFERLPRFEKRNLINTYVWTADGGLFAETEETVDVRQETSGGAYTLKGMAGATAVAELSIAGVATEFALDALFGGHLNLILTKTADSQSSFGLDVALDLEADVYERDEQNRVVLDRSDPRNPQPIKRAGKVDAYRFMTFYLEPRSDNFDLFFNRVVDPIWLESDEPAAQALREARQDKERPPCWRVMHRVTYVSRVLERFATPGATPLERALPALDIDSNFELIKTLEPLVRTKTGSIAEFVRAVDDALRGVLPELWDYRKEIVEFMALYLGVVDEQLLLGGELPSLEEALTDAPIVSANQAPGQPGPAEQPGPVVVDDHPPPVAPPSDPVAIPADPVPPVVPSRAAPAISFAAVPPINLPDLAQLRAEIRSDWAPPEGFMLLWTQQSGPDGVGFADTRAAATTANFPRSGRYTLRLTVEDVDDVFKDLEVIANQTPAIEAGSPQTIQLAGVAQLAGRVLDDGLGDPALGSLTMLWEQADGPGIATFFPADALETTARFDTPGTYELKLTVSNGFLTAFDTLTLTVVSRAAADLLALYAFEEGVGATVRDLAGVQPPLDLAIGDPAAIGWLEHALVLTTPTILTAVDALRLIDAVRTTGEISVEAWVVAAEAPAHGLARIVTLSNGPAARNLTFGVSGGAYHAGLRTTTTNPNASNKALAGGSVSPCRLTQVVMTRAASGVVRLYVDGREASSRLVSGDLSSWERSFTLAIGNELGGGPDRAWCGELHLVAIYGRALTPDEVALNFAFGADLDLAPTVDAGPDHIVDLPPGQSSVDVALHASLRDDRTSAGALRYGWSFEGPADGAAISAPQTLDAVAIFANRGRYMLRLMVDDGGLLATDTLEVIVNTIPTISAGEPQTVDLPNTLDLDGTVTDDGLGDPALGTLTTRWSQIRGPAQAGFADQSNLKTAVRFPCAGRYELRLTADNGRLAATAGITVDVYAAPAIAIEALSIVDMPLGVSAEGTLAAIVHDSGLGDLPDTLTYHWEQVAGRAARIANPDAPGTTVVFDESGVCVFCLAVGNGRFETRAETTVVANRQPVVEAGADQIVNLPPSAQEVSVTLDGTVTDDGLPDPPGYVVMHWEKVDGPGEVIFDNATADYTTARFTASGVYTLRLSAADYEGGSGASDELTVTVNRPPVVDAGDARTILWPVGADHIEVTLAADVSDDGLPSGALHIAWSQISGPGEIVFADSARSDTTAIFPASGIYALKLTADDGFAQTEDTVTITLNRAPVVAVGGPFTVILPDDLALEALASDDGLPSDALTVVWSQVDGPGIVTFANAAVAATTAHFSRKGHYVLRLTASDGASETFVELPVVVNATPTVAIAGPRWIPAGATATFVGTIDDGLAESPGATSARWEQVEGPGTAEFTAVDSPTTTVAFSLPGRYRLRLTVDNSFRSSAAELQIMVGGRVSDGLLTLYTFAEGAGTIVHDVSEVDEPLNLKVTGARGATRWTAGGLTIVKTALIASQGAATKIIDAVRQTNEVSIEVWITPAAEELPEPGVPARIVTISRDPESRNITLQQGQWEKPLSDFYHVRLRTTETDDNSIPDGQTKHAIATEHGSLRAALQHVVYVRSAAGQARIYIDGVERVEARLPGGCSNWDRKLRLGLANELNNHRAWYGTFHLVAIYGRALTAEEVGVNFAAGVSVCGQ